MIDQNGHERTELIQGREWKDVTKSRKKVDTVDTLLTKLYVKQLKDKIRAAEKAGDAQLLKLFVLMLLIAVAAFLIQGRINFFK